MKTQNTQKQVWTKLFIVSAIIVILTGLGATFIYIPFTAKSKTLRDDILKERDKNILIGKIKALNKYIKIYDKKILGSGDVSWFLGEVSNIASKERIEVTSIKPGSPEPYGLYSKVFVIVDITSTYSQLGRFIADIESSEKFLKIENVNIKRMDIDEKLAKGQVKFKAFDVKASVVISAVSAKE
jgi:Tfp pilus assembly protein PilO